MLSSWYLLGQMCPSIVPLLFVTLHLHVYVHVLHTLSMWDHDMVCLYVYLHWVLNVQNWNRLELWAQLMHPSTCAYIVLLLCYICGRKEYYNLFLSLLNGRAHAEITSWKTCLLTEITSWMHRRKSRKRQWNIVRSWNEWHLLHQICLQAVDPLPGRHKFEPGLATVVEILSSWAPLRRKLFLFSIWAWA